jgi:uncharacterized membrane protein
MSYTPPPDDETDARMDEGPQPPVRGAGADAQTTPAVVVYALYLASIVSGLTALIGVIVAYVYRGKDAAWLDTHFTFQIRTFWMLLLYSLIGGALTLVLIGWLMLLFVLVWLLVRCVRGIQFVSRGQPYPNPGSWLW